MFLSCLIRQLKRKKIIDLLKTDNIFTRVDVKNIFDDRVLVLNELNELVISVAPKILFNQFNIYICYHNNF